MNRNHKMWDLIPFLGPRGQVNLSTCIRIPNLLPESVKRMTTKSFWPKLGQHPQLCLLLSQLKVKKENLSIKDAVGCFGLCDKPWTWRGRGAGAGPHWDPVLHWFLTWTASLSATRSSWMPKTLCGNTSVEQVCGGVVSEKRKEKRWSALNTSQLLRILCKLRKYSQPMTV